MYLDYSKLEFDRNGLPETPQLVLKTLGDKMVGIIPGVHNLKLNIKFSEPSEISFDIPSVIDGEPNPLYDDVTGFKQIFTKCYGVYETMNPSTDADGIREVKHVKGYSYEKTLETKKFFLEEGTFNFWNPASPIDTVLGRILEVAVGWSVGYVSPSLIGKYRTFDQYDDYLLSFMYSHAPEKYRCVFVFDTYKKTINVYDADEERPTLPIYLDFDNLIESLGVEEKSDELVTAIRPYGADELGIRDVNPIGTNWIYDLSYFIANGDIREPLASKWVSWQTSILNRQQYYRGLTAMRASSTARLTAAQAALTDLKGELDTLTAKQSVTIQASAMEITNEGKAYQQSLLDDINQKIAAKKNEIAVQEGAVASINSELDPNNPSSYAAQIQAIVKELSISNYFTEEEYSELSNFLIEQDITEETFVATDVDTTVSGSSYPLSGERLSITGSAISGIDLTSQFNKRMYTMSGGAFSLSGNRSISGDIIRGTLEVASNGSYVLSLYAGTLKVGDKTTSSGMVTMSGSMSNFANDVRPTTTRYPTDLGEDIYITTDEGTSLSFNASGSMYLTASVSEYQRYSVEMELYEYAVGVLDDIATPTYEFSVDSANFLFAQEFVPFRNQLELGKGVYLNVGGRRPITPYIIEFELDFESRDKFSIVFSNRFKRHDNVNTLKDMIESSYSTSRSFDASKYIYNQTVGQASMVSKFMSDSLDAAKNTILAAANQSVIINGAGIHVGGDSKYQIRIVDSMIAMSDDNWGTCKLAIGHFASPEIGEYFGVNAEVIGGKLIVGNNLIIENENDDGIMQFRVDSSGAWLNNSTFVLQKDNGGKIIIDPKYGIVGGSGLLYTTNGTTVTPSFIKSNGSIDKDTDDMPKNANFFLDIQNGNAYFRGKLIATSGKLGGFDIASSYLYSGTGSNRVAVNGGTSYYSLYAFWAGNENPASAPFWVQKNGKMRATDCIITGTLDASKIKGSLTAETGAELVGPAIYVPNKTTPKFKVDSSGNVTMSGDIHMENGNITWGTSSSPVRVLYSRTYASTPTMLYTSYPVNSSSGWHRTLDTGRDIYASHSYDGGKTWTGAIKLQGEDGEDGRDGRDGADGSDANVTRGNIARALYENSADYYNDGIYSYRYGSRYYLAINASYILAGDIDADNIALTCGYGGFSKGYGSTGTRRTYGSMMYGSNGKGYEPYFIVTDMGCRMSAPNDIDFFITGGGVYSAEEPSITSDRRLKNSIEYNMEKYEKFFMLLKPTQYRLNRGMSGRFHTGFIAQDVEQAVLESGLELTDFAGITIMPVEEVNEKDGIEDNYYKLRYGEFISLNTHMIQKLYRRIDELEEKINSMN